MRRGERTIWPQTNKEGGHFTWRHMLQRETCFCNCRPASLVCVFGGLGHGLVRALGAGFSSWPPPYCLPISSALFLASQCRGSNFSCCAPERKTRSVSQNLFFLLKVGHPGLWLCSDVCFLRCTGLQGQQAGSGVRVWLMCSHGGRGRAGWGELGWR